MSAARIAKPSIAEAANGGTSFGRAGVERERAPERVVEVDLLGVEHVGVREHGRARLLDRDSHGCGR